MKRFGKVLVLTLGIIGLSLILGIATSHEVRAAVSALVTVANTSAQPVPVQEVDAKNAFQTSVQLSLSGTSGTGVSIPTGNRLVIDYISVAGAGPSAGTQPYIVLYSTVGATPQVNYTLTPTQSNLAAQQFQDSEAVKIYADSLFVSLAFAGANPPFLIFNVTISGHLVPIP